ncbi:alpha/beta fold hydrolase [Mycobacterium adipatum]|uniref:alpha/beta fold hydrolase n=1 Tax=Mycobacterium adipatum TaxID=1682113 RepID=UPI0034E0E16A
MTVLDAPGAQLYFEVHGQGPLMVMIPGAGGTADSFRMVAEHLAADYTIVLYDRRGFSRSRLDGPQDYSHRLNTDADDVRRLIEHVGGGPATVFGASSGAIVALALQTRHPEVVHALVPFEPPAVLQLPDGDRWVEFFHQVYDLYQHAGIGPAMQWFRAQTFPHSDQQVMGAVPRNEANAIYWFEHELRQYPAVQLDLNSLSLHAERILLAVGREGRGYPAHDVSVVLARKFGRNTVELPGGHVGAVSHPAAFAQELTTALAEEGLTATDRPNTHAPHRRLL